MEREFKSRAARDADRIGWGGSRYAEYLERAESARAEFYRERGDDAAADRIMNRSLAEALRGNDGA